MSSLLLGSPIGVTFSVSLIECKLLPLLRLRHHMLKLLLVGQSVVLLRKRSWSQYSSVWGFKFQLLGQKSYASERCKAIATAARDGLPLGTSGQLQGRQLQLRLAAPGDDGLPPRQTHKRYMSQSWFQCLCLPPFPVPLPASTVWPAVQAGYRTRGLRSFRAPNEAVGLHGLPRTADSDP